jgi:hypothetical protein
MLAAAMTGDMRATVPTCNQALRRYSAVWHFVKLYSCAGGYSYWWREVQNGVGFCP